MNHSSSLRWHVPVLFAVLGGGVSAVVWLVMNQFGVGNGFGWPFNSLTTITALGAIAGTVYGRAFQAHRLRRQAAAEDPVEPLPESAADSDAELSGLPEMEAFARKIEIARRSTEHVAEAIADVFDLTTEESDGDGGTIRVTRTFVLFPAAGLPAFELQPRRLASQIMAWGGLEGVRFDPAAAETADDVKTLRQFAATYWLTTNSLDAVMSGRVESGEDAVRQTFRLDVLRQTLRRSDWRVQCQREHVVFWTGGDPLGPQRRAKLVAEAVALRTEFLAAYAGTSGDRVLPAPPGTVSSARQAARLQAAVR